MLLLLILTVCLLGKQMLVNLVDILIEENMYDMAFTIIVNFWKGSKLKW